MQQETSKRNGNNIDGNGAFGSSGAGRSRHRSSRGMARWNALKHGVLSESVVLPGEEKAQYQELLEQLRKDLGPQGALEELLVERIATCFWRLRRILRYDFGFSEEEAYSGPTQVIVSFVDPKDPTRLLSSPPSTDTGTEADAAMNVTDSKSESVADSKSESVNDSKSVMVTDSKKIDTLIRYESAIERQLYRAIDQLERLQRHRAGDYVPPPAKVNVSTDV